MTGEQRKLFLSTAQKVVPRLYPLFATLASTGVRLGEAVALQRGGRRLPRAGDSH